MKTTLFYLCVVPLFCFSQSIQFIPLSFKGEHYALYNKCKSPVTFCELTQQDYTSCGSVKNCYGLYVVPGDTFYINIEDKTQSETLSADVSFGGYFPSISGFTFQPIDLNCLPQQALKIVIPLAATVGSSFQVIASNTANVNDPAYLAGVPPPFTIFVGGQQPQFTFALSDYTLCPMAEEVSVKENGLNETSNYLWPNPSKGIFFLKNLPKDKVDLILYDSLGNIVFEKTLTEHSIDLSFLNDGIYMGKIRSARNSVSFQHLIIQK